MADELKVVRMGSDTQEGVDNRVREPEKGEFHYNETTKRWKAGDGVNNYEDLPSLAYTKDLLPVGAHIWFPVDTPPEGYLVENGAAVSREVYAELFTVIGTKFGEGDGSTTFNLPDLQDEFIRGAGAGREVGSSQGDAARRQIQTNWMNGATTRGNKQFYIGGTTMQSLTYNGSVAAMGSSVTENARPNSPAITVHDYTTNEAFPIDEENRPQNIAFLPCIKY